MSLSLDGFSQDGKQIFGIISESGTFPLVTLFDYNTTSDEVGLVDLKKMSKRLKAAGCGQSLAVAGTTEAGEVVLEPRQPCASSDRWLLDPNGEPRSLAKGRVINGLYQRNGR